MNFGLFRLFVKKRSSPGQEMLCYVYKSTGDSPVKVSVETQDVNTDIHTAQEIYFL